MTPSPTYCPHCATALGMQHDGERERPTCPNCGFIHYDNPDPVVAALVEHEGDVILARNEAWPETWFGLISGFLERGETPEDATLREVKEELGLDGDIVALIGVYAFFERNQVIVAYHVRATGTIHLGDELAAVRRVPPGELKPWPVGTGHAVRDWLRTHGYAADA